MMRAVSAVVFLIAVLPADVLGQISPEDRYRILPHFGFQFFSTDRAGFFAGMTYRPSFESDREAFWAPVLGGEVGIAGGQLNVGLSRYFRPAISDVGGIGSAISVKGTLTYQRTWGDPAHVGPRQSFLGPELQLMWSVVGLRLGYFGRVSGQSPGDQSFITLGVVLGWH